MKHQLEKVELVIKAPKRGALRKRRDRAPLAGMMIQQDESSASHEHREMDMNRRQPLLPTAVISYRILDIGKVRAEV